MLATELLLALRPCPLPASPIGIAIIGITRAAYGHAAEPLLLLRPALLPIDKLVVAIIRQCARVDNATSSCVVATILLLLIMPRVLPTTIPLLTIVLATTSAHCLAAEFPLPR